MPAWDDITPQLERRRRERRAPLTGVLLILNLAAFAAAFIAKLPALQDWVGFSWPTFVESQRYWTLLTNSFLHPTQPTGLSILWMAIGCMAIFGCGRRLEHEFGGKAVFFLYIGASAAGAGLHAIYEAITGTPAPLFGFHAPVAALILADAVSQPDRIVRVLVIFPVRAAIAAWLAIAGLTVLAATQPGGGASPFAVGGAVVFTLSGAILAARFGRAWALLIASRARARFLEEFMVRRETDEILDKILHNGLDSLTARERRTLNRASRLLRRESAPRAWTVGDANR